MSAGEGAEVGRSGMRHRGMRPALATYEGFRERRSHYAGNALWKRLQDQPEPAQRDMERPCWRCAREFRTGERDESLFPDLFRGVTHPELRERLVTLVREHLRRYCEACCRILLVRPAAAQAKFARAREGAA